MNHLHAHCWDQNICTSSSSYRAALRSNWGTNVSYCPTLTQIVACFASCFVSGTVVPNPKHCFWSVWHCLELEVTFLNNFDAPKMLGAFWIINLTKFYLMKFLVEFKNIMPWPHSFEILTRWQKPSNGSDQKKKWRLTCGNVLE